MAFLNHLKPKVFQYRAPALFKISGSVPETYHSACQAILITSQIGFDIASTKVETTWEQDQVEKTLRYFFPVYITYNLHRNIKLTITRYLTNICVLEEKNLEIMFFYKTIIYSVYNNPIKVDHQIFCMIKWIQEAFDIRVLITESNESSP